MTLPFVDRPGCSARAKDMLAAGALAGFIVSLVLAARFVVFEVFR